MPTTYLLLAFCCLPFLAHPDFRVRERASAALAELAWAVDTSPVTALAERWGDAEAVRRCREAEASVPRLCDTGWAHLWASCQGVGGGVAEDDDAGQRGATREYGRWLLARGWRQDWGDVRGRLLHEVAARNRGRVANALAGVPVRVPAGDDGGP
jgi:hypothetical protein